MSIHLIASTLLTVPRYLCDVTIYYQTLVEKNGAFKQCYAAAAPRKGMPASAVLTSKIITTFRPKYIAMAGITSGYSSKTKSGDVIAADPVWDWGSGKLINRDGKSVFEPEPHQLDLEVDIRTQWKLMANDVAALAQIIPFPHSVGKGDKPSPSSLW